MSYIGIYIFDFHRGKLATRISEILLYSHIFKKWRGHSPIFRWEIRLRKTRSCRPGYVCGGRGVEGGGGGWNYKAERLFSDSNNFSFRKQ